jgi:hypothetical protein
VKKIVAHLSCNSNLPPGAPGGDRGDKVEKSAGVQRPYIVDCQPAAAKLQAATIAANTLMPFSVGSSHPVMMTLQNE